MKTTKARKYMERIEKLDAMLENKIAEREFWQSKAMSITASMGGERVMSSGSQQKMADAIDKYIDLERENIDKIKQQRQEIIETIEQLNAIEYYVLYKLYVQYWTLSEIADAKHQSYSWATTMKGRALQSLQRLLNEREKNGKNKTC